MAVNVQTRRAGREIEVELRREPTQARAKQTFERILGAAAELLQEGGWDGFNTNLLAERAGIGLQTLYRYFPNKEAVVRTLARRMFDAWNATFPDFEAALEVSDGDWPVVWGEFVDRYVEGLRATPGAVAIRCAIAASPPLREIDQADNEVIARNVAGALRRWRPDRPGGDARATAVTLIESATAVTDRAIAASPREAARILEALKAMQSAYLREWLGDDD